MRAVRAIVQIDEDRCTGCGECIPSCEEGAIEIVDGKAKLVADVYCDGLGNCLGTCPEEAITMIDREADGFDEEQVQERLKETGHDEPTAAASCPGSAVLNLKEEPVCDCPTTALKPQAAAGGRGMGLRCPRSVDEAIDAEEEEERVAAEGGPRESQLGNWPVQLKLVPVEAPYWDGADVLIAADCAPFAAPDFHERLLTDHVLTIGCPKLDEGELYVKKLGQIFARNSIKSVH
ncbi:MAG TPA: 4Fe-4S binding protein, partial [Armatimonadota bacterium]|nr:4Fe-4S binding protein [Armatimonadota bacterium]